MKSLLDKLQIDEINSGACTGADGWISDPAGTRLISYNPTLSKNAVPLEALNTAEIVIFVTPGMGS